VKSCCLQKKAFERHELIKVKFNDFKKKEEKTEISGRIEKGNRIGECGHDRAHGCLLPAAGGPGKTEDLPASAGWLTP